MLPLAHLDSNFLLNVRFTANSSCMMAEPWQLGLFCAEAVGFLRKCIEATAIILLTLADKVSLVMLAKFTGTGLFMHTCFCLSQLHFSWMNTSHNRISTCPGLQLKRSFCCFHFGAVLFDNDSVALQAVFHTIWTSITSKQSQLLTCHCCRWVKWSSSWVSY